MGMLSDELSRARASTSSAALVDELDGARAWYWEHGQGRVFNVWSLAHVGSGVASFIAWRSYLPGIVLHTAYELMEDRIYPYHGRDRSMANHIGDTVAFVAGQLAGAWLVGDDNT
jgi:hypothetical protein